ncbi:MAG: hypothetical protein PVF81_03080 [Thioalkalispiraceae bacterium]|jgi:hypothetical protein
MHKQSLLNSLLVLVGFILSPLTWWNDLLVNVPLAYLFSLPFSMLNDHFFLPAFIVGYYLSNLLGLVMLHWGGKGLLSGKYPAFNLKQSLLVSVIYTLVISIIVWAGWLEAPSVYLKQTM